MSSHGHGGRGGAVTGTSRSLLSGKAKKEQMKEKREAERVKAEKRAAWEKRQQQATEQQQIIQHRQQQHQQKQHDEEGKDDDEEEEDKEEEEDDQQQTTQLPPHTNTHAQAPEDDDDVLLPRKLNNVTLKPQRAHMQSISSSAASTSSSLPAMAALELSGEQERNKLRTAFVKETKEEVERRKAESRLPLQRTGPLDGSCPSINCWSELIDLPVRPPWSRSQTPKQLQGQEEAYFQQWLTNVYSKYPPSRLNHFEHNLEVWRQLWRVCEQSDLLLVIVDVRWPTLNFPPTLYHYVVHSIHKPLVMVLNKIDMIPQQVLNNWLQYFQHTYPALHVIPYSTQPRSLSLPTNEAFDVLKKNKQKVAGGSLMLNPPYGAEQLLVACRQIIQQHQALPQQVKQSFSFDPTLIQAVHTERTTTDKQHTEQQSGSSHSNKPGKHHSKDQHSRQHKAVATGDDDEEAVVDEADEEDEDIDSDLLSSQYSNVLGRLDDNDSAPADISASRQFVTLGTIGAPNAGKSSVINSLAGRKLVSVSKTPGHTKYLQTLFLNPHTRLCDCPGLVFPAVDLPKAVQVLSGCFNIAQTRDPYSAVKFLAERLPLEKIYKLKPVPEDERGEYTYDDGERWVWTAWSLCEAFAYQKGFRNRHGVLDVYRAANFICRDAINGVIVLYSTPPNTSSTQTAANSKAEDKSKQSNTLTSGASTQPKKGKGKTGKGRRRRDSSTSDDEDEAD